MKRLLCFSLLFLLLLTGCTPKPVQQQFFAMDTVMSITAYGRSANDAVTAAVAKVNELEGLLSRTRTDSEVTALYLAAPESVPLSDDTLRVLTLAQEWHRKTGGAFDVTIAPVAAAWGFGGSGEYQVPTPEKLEELLAMVDGASLILTEAAAALPAKGMEVDLGGIAKGYAASQAEQVLRDAGVEHALLDLGRNITVIGSKPDGSAWRVAVQDPNNSSGMVGVLSLQDCSAVTSGGYQRYFEQGGTIYHHIIDPRTGYPADSGLISTTVVCADAGLADLLSTATFVLGEEDALELWRREGGFELILVTEDGRVVVTNGLKDVFSPDHTTNYTVEYAN